MMAAMIRALKRGEGGLKPSRRDAGRPAAAGRDLMPELPRGRKKGLNSKSLISYSRFIIVQKCCCCYCMVGRSHSITLDREPQRMEESVISVTLLVWNLDKAMHVCGGGGPIVRTYEYVFYPFLLSCSSSLSRQQQQQSLRCRIFSSPSRTWIACSEGWVFLWPISRMHRSALLCVCRPAVVRRRLRRNSSSFCQASTLETANKGKKRREIILPLNRRRLPKCSLKGPTTWGPSFDPPLQTFSFVQKFQMSWSRTATRANPSIVSQPSGMLCGAIRLSVIERERNVSFIHTAGERGLERDYHRKKIRVNPVGFGPARRARQLFFPLRTPICNLELMTLRVLGGGCRPSSCSQTARAMPSHAI